MFGRKALWALLIVWAALYVWSVAAFSMTAPTGDGFTRGLNRVTAFVGWQTAAGAVGLVIWLNAHVFPKRSVGRWLGRLPIILALLLIASVITIVLLARFGN